MTPPTRERTSVNYLGHYVFNQQVCGLEPEPYFVMGVALPDLWPRFSRKRRIRWKCVHEASSSDPRANQLRDGLLNHVAVDRRFHALPSFAGWQRALKARVAADGTHPALLDFLAHLALELTIDQHLLRENSRLADQFFDSLEECDYAVVEASVGRVAAVDARGLKDLLRTFVGRRFLRHYTEPGALFGVMRHTLSLTSVRQAPDDCLLCDLLEKAAESVDPPVIWSALKKDHPSSSFADPIL